MEPLNITHDAEPTARTLLSSALDDEDPDARNVVELLDVIPGAYERAQLSLEQAETGECVSLDEL